MCTGYKHLLGTYRLPGIGGVAAWPGARVKGGERASERGVVISFCFKFAGRVLPRDGWQPRPVSRVHTTLSVLHYVLSRDVLCLSGH